MCVCKAYVCIDVHMHEKRRESGGWRGGGEEGIVENSITLYRAIVRHG